MSYIGSTPTTQSFIAGTDYFNGNGSTVNFTLSRSVNSVNDIEVIVNNVEQIPSGYSVSGTTLTFSVAPSSGTSNVYVRYLSTTLLSVAPTQGSSMQFGIGSAALPSISFTGDTNTGIFLPAADTIAFSEGGVEAARLDSAGNMGLGVTPSAWGSNNRTIDMYGIGSFSSFSNGAGGYELDVSLNAYNSASGWRYKVSSYAVALYQQAAGSHIWYNAASGTAGNAISFTQAMTLDASGNLLVGTTNANAKLHVAVTSATNPINANVNYTSSTNISGIRVTKFDNNTTTAQRFIEFVIDAGATGCGQINANGASAAAFGSYSDSRLKENITNLPSQLANIMALRPVEFDYIQSEGGGHQIGFIAQEVNEVYPDLVGERADGMFTLTDLNKNDARLIKAIQELKAIVDAQAARITALENNNATQ